MSSLFLQGKANSLLVLLGRGYRDSFQVAILIEIDSFVGNDCKGKLQSTLAAIARNEIVKNTCKICFFLSLFSFTWGETYAASEGQLDRIFAAQIMPDFWSRGSSEYMITSDAKRLHYRKYYQPGQDKVLVILPGRTESTWKFAEFIHDIKDLNFAVFILDHRGQGASEREVTDSNMGYIADFSVYKDDLALFMNTVIKPLGFKQHLALGHSMGANILALYMAEQQSVFAKAVVTSPMLDINTAPLPSAAVAHLIASLACWLGMDKNYTLNSGPYQANEAFRGTTSEIRFRLFRQLRIARAAEQVGGASYRFAQKALEATQTMRDQAEKLSTPLLMLQAGSDDVVLTGGQDFVCQHAKNCRKVVIPGALHELHIETDRLRDVWLAEVRGFFTSP